MFQVIQSNDTDVLVDELIRFYQKPCHDQADFGTMIFSPFVVIVPSMVLGHWLKKQVAQKAGISTMITAQFWGQYQWGMIKQALDIDAKIHSHDALVVPEVAMLSASVMRWRLFGFLSGKAKSQELLDILNDDDHALHFLFKPLAEQTKGCYDIPARRLWQACDEISRLYVRYLTHRPKWLDAWAKNESLDGALEQMIADKDRFGDEYGQKEGTPDWLIVHYKNLEKLLHFLWHELFKQAHQMRQALEYRFWDILEGRRGKELCQKVLDKLPKDLYLFTVQQLTQVELLFLKRLSLVTNIRLLHFNPSKMFWSDIVDKNWLLTQDIINPNSVYQKDYGHGLLSRLGKESRETFAMLADMSGGEFYYEHDKTQQLNHIGHLNDREGVLYQIDWQDKFQSKINGGHDSILNQLKQDILMLGEDENVKGMAMGEVLEVLGDKKYQKSTAILSELNKKNKEFLPSLSIHACHSLKRQLEIARTMIAKYLNDHQGKLSDVVMLLPDVAEVQNTIRMIFPDGVGVDGLYLPIKITGITAREIDELLQAILGFYQLCGVKHARFYASEFYEWLLNPAVYENFGLNFDEAHRAKALLEVAGFRRGFDASHVGQTLHDTDTDYRYTFSYALDRIVMGFVSPNERTSTTLLHPFEWVGGMSEATLILEGVGLSDQNIVQALCRMHEALAYFGRQYQQQDKVQHWLNKIENELIDDYFYAIKQTVKMRAIFEAKNAMLASLRANTHHGSDDIYLTLEFVLDSLMEAVGLQAVAAEPADVITVARFGSLRSVPFGLTIMLDMNLSAYPRQDKGMRLDLMRAGLKRRGDRTNEDDDNGAFLDALLCTKEVCLIFYDGMSADGSTVLPPASPVTELLEFLKSDMDWHLPDLADDLTRQVSEYMPKLIERYLLTWHGAMSFERSLFYCTDSLLSNDNPVAVLTNIIDHKKRELQLFLPPAPLWKEVRQVLDARADESINEVFIRLPTTDELVRIQDVFTQIITKTQDSNQSVDELLADYCVEIPDYLAVQSISSAIKSPAKAYLRGKFLVSAAQEETIKDEPLSLGGLKGWQVGDILLQAFATGVFDGQNIADLDAKTMFDVTIPYDSSSQQQQPLTRLKALRHEPLLPAGTIKEVRLKQEIGLIGDILGEFFDELGDVHGEFSERLGLDVHDGQQFSAFITPTQEQAVAVNIGNTSLKILAQLPEQTNPCWLNILVSSFSPNKLLDCWVHHLLWQIYRQTTIQDEQNGVGASIWRHKKVQTKTKMPDTPMVVFRPMCADKAIAHLQNLVLFALLAQAVPLVLTTVNALLVLQSGESFDETKLVDCVGKDSAYSSKDVYWETLLRGQDVHMAMSQTIPLIIPLYGEILQYWTTLTQLGESSSGGKS